MIEAMACGTPVIAFAAGSVPEVIDDGVTGFIVDTVEEAAAAVVARRRIDRAEVRAGASSAASPPNGWRATMSSSIAGCCRVQRTHPRLARNDSKISLDALA